MSCPAGGHRAPAASKPVARVPEATSDPSQDRPVDYSARATADQPRGRGCRNWHRAATERRIRLQPQGHPAARGDGRYRRAASLRTSRPNLSGADLATIFSNSEELTGRQATWTWKLAVRSAGPRAPRKPFGSQRTLAGQLRKTSLQRVRNAEGALTFGFASA
jgi:hypothetical protein